MFRKIDGASSPMLLPMVGKGAAVIKLGEMMILELHRQGLTVSAIAKPTCADCGIRVRIMHGCPHLHARDPQRGVVSALVVETRTIDGVTEVGTGLAG